QHVNHPSEVVNVGDEVTVKVLEVDRERERISLSIRETLEDPWDVFSRQYEVGDIVEGTVTKTVPFGAFVSVMEGVEGLVHVSEIAVHRVESPELELSIGQKVRTKITEPEDERRRISLSITQALPDREVSQERARAASGGPSRPRREFEREFGPKEEEPPPMPVDASLEAILQELKERGIGRRCGAIESNDCPPVPRRGTVASGGWVGRILCPRTSAVSFSAGWDRSLGLRHKVFQTLTVDADIGPGKPGTEEGAR